MIQRQANVSAVFAALALLSGCSAEQSLESCGANGARWAEAPYIHASSAFADYRDLDQEALTSAQFVEPAGGRRSLDIRAVFTDGAELGRRTGFLEEPGFTVLVQSADVESGQIMRDYGVSRRFVRAGGPQALQTPFPSDANVDGAIFVSDDAIVAAECFVKATGDVAFERAQYRECLLRGLGLNDLRIDPRQPNQSLASGAQCLRRLYRV